MSKVPIESLKRFVNAVHSICSEEYLRSTNDADMARLVPIGEASVKFLKRERRICEKLIPEGRLMSNQKKEKGRLM